MTLWLIEANQQRRRLLDRSFTPCFYVHGPEARLTRLGQTLAARAPVACALTERTNIWDGGALGVLQVSVHHPTQFARLVRFVHRYDPTLTLYNADLMLAPVYCWEKRIFPLAKVEVEVGEGSALPREPGGLPYQKARRAGPAEICAIACRDDEWATDYELPPLKILRTRLEGLASVNPQHGRRGTLEVEVEGEWRVLDDAEEPVAEGLARLLRRHDPDLILSEWGDSTLFPGLLRQARRCRIELPLNRDPAYGAIQRSRARSYMSYGRVLFKESATTFFGRLHVDTQNSFIADQCDLEGLWELVRVTRLPVQYCARTTTGTGISYMQMELAYRDGVLIPEQKAEPESPKHPDELLLADRGGLVFPPRLGFFENVGELDFISEYPSIMARFNISPETINCRCCPQAARVPELGYRVCQRRRGITSRVVERLIRKREQYKQLAAAAVSDRPPPVGTLALQETSAPVERRERYRRRRSALKWLLVTCFGYTGYKNARFGKIEAHEAINALAREKLLVAKEIAEARGFRVLHALVDSLYVQKEDATREDYERLAWEISQRTDLPMALEAVYRYVVFLPSKQALEVPVPNRFFCVPEKGAVKIRGLECRKHDTPPLVARMQREALAILAEAQDFASYCRKLEEAREVLARHLARLEAGSISLEELVISRRLTRSPHDYQHASATAIAAKQLDRSGVQLRPGEMIEYLITDADSNYPDDRVRALTMWESWRGYDIAKYKELLFDAFQPFEHFAAPPKGLAKGPVLPGLNSPLPSCP
jgi:DNA polymerase elongation subunit (family B)